MKYVVCAGAIFCAAVFCSIALMAAEPQESGYAASMTRVAAQ